MPGFSRSNSNPSRTKRPKIFRRKCSGMPRPLSAIRTITGPSPSRRRLTSTRGGEPAYFTALSIRLRKIDVQVDPPADDDARLQIEPHGVGRHAVVHADRRGAVAQQRRQVHVFLFALGPLGVEPAGVEHLVDQVVEPFEVFEHEAVEIGLHLLAHLMPAERLQVEFHRRDGRFQLVRDAVDEVRLPPREVDGLDREDQVEHHADQQQQDERRADRAAAPNTRRTGSVSFSAPKTVSSTQPTVSTTSKVIMPMASKIGSTQGAARRHNMLKHSSWAKGPSSGGMWWSGELQSRQVKRGTGILPVFHGQDGRATKACTVLPMGWSGVD